MRGLQEEQDRTVAQRGEADAARDPKPAGDTTEGSPKAPRRPARARYTGPSEEDLRWFGECISRALERRG